MLPSAATSWRTGTEEGHFYFVLEMTPKFEKKYLMRGRVWVDQSGFAIVRMEGSPAKNPYDRGQNAASHDRR